MTKTTLPVEIYWNLEVLFAAPLAQIPAHNAPIVSRLNEHVFPQQLKQATATNGSLSAV